MNAEMLVLQYSTRQSAVWWIEMTLLFWILAVGVVGAVASVLLILVLQLITRGVTNLDMYFPGYTARILN